MAGTWVSTLLTPYSMNASPTTGTFFAGLPASYGYDVPGTGITAWGGSPPYGVLVPNTGSVWLWYYNGPTNAGGIVQVLVGEVVAGQVLAATTAETLVVSSSGWLGPFSAATYNVVNPAMTWANNQVTGAMPAAAAGCVAISFALTTQLLVRAYSFQSIQP